ncbi:MAG: threonine synthase [Acetobacteraceae bacterium]
MQELAADVALAGGIANEERLVCTECGQHAAIRDMPSTCPRCDGILDARFPDKPETVSDEAGNPGIWHWRRFLPDCAPVYRVTLGEGRTPLLTCARLGAELGLETFWVKNDAIMPTSSFKDRAIAVAISLARQYGKRGVVLSSSGNAGASAAAYAARAGLPAVVLVPATAPRSKLTQILVHGARLVTVQGETSDCCRLAAVAARRFGWVNLTTTYCNPYGVDGYATIAYEIAAMRPEVLLLPISCGPLLAGVMKGFTRMQALGLIEHVPRPVAVQPAGCAPIVRAFTSGARVTAWTPEHTIASALNDTLAGYERDGDYTLAWLRRCGGTAVAVSDEAVVRAVCALAEREGLFVEPSAAVPVAAISNLVASGWLDRSQRVVAVATGHGLKDVPAAAIPDLPAPIEPTEAALSIVLDQVAVGPP